MSKRALVIADADSFWTRSLIAEVLLKGGYDVTVFPIWEYGGKQDAFYSANGVSVYRDEHTLPIVRHIPRLRLWARVWLNAKSLCESGRFELVTNQYLSPRDLALGMLVSRRQGARWVSTFWGSDLLRASAGTLRDMKPYLEKCGAVTVQGESHTDIIAEKFGGSVAGRTVHLSFGHSGFTAIDEVAAHNDRRACKAHFGIDPDSIVICPGYNAAPAQNHEKLLRALKKARCIDRATVVLQMTYCEPDGDYIPRITALAKELGIRTLVLTEFMDETECAYLRLAADIFIHAITTDAFSASMCEYLYAGAAVIKGAWLKYRELDDIGAQIAEFSDFDELAPLLDAAAEGEIAPITREQRALLCKGRTWDDLRADWLKIFARQ